MAQRQKQTDEGLAFFNDNDGRTLVRAHADASNVTVSLPTTSGTLALEGSGGGGGGGTTILMHTRTDTDASIDITGAAYATPLDVTTDFTLEVGTYIAEFSYSYDSTAASPYAMCFRYNGTAVFTANQGNPIAIGNSIASADGSGSMIPTSNDTTAYDGFVNGAGGSAVGRIEWKQVFKVTTGGTFKLQASTVDSDMTSTHYIYSGFTKLTKAA